MLQNIIAFLVILLISTSCIHTKNETLYEVVPCPNGSAYDSRHKHEFKELNFNYSFYDKNILEQILQSKTANDDLTDFLDFDDCIVYLAFFNDETNKLEYLIGMCERNYLFMIAKGENLKLFRGKIIS